MCGIVAYIGSRDAYPILIKGLQRLEYRGYDSAGVALIKDEALTVYKKKGKVNDLVEFTKDKDVSGTIGMGHTRWATHGEPNDVTEIATRFAEIAVDQSDEGGFATAFHSVVCGFAIKGKLLFIFLKRTIESCFDRNIEASPAPIVCFFYFPPRTFSH